VSYLLDTNILSELRKGPRCNATVAHWSDAQDPGTFHISVLALGEIRRGVERLRRRDGAQAKVLDGWLGQVRATFAGRILPVDEAAVDLWGRFDPSRPLPVIDALMAATARVHGLVLVTRNVADVPDTGVEVFNPFDDPPRQ
jgi:predicted nucleic acid-binding protein